MRVPSSKNPQVVTFGDFTSEGYIESGTSGELFVGPDPQFRRRDTNMSLIYAGTLRWRWTRVLKLVTFILGWVPEASLVHGRNGQILSDSSNPRRDTLHTSTVW